MVLCAGQEPLVDDDLVVSCLTIDGDTSDIDRSNELVVFLLGFGQIAR